MSDTEFISILLGVFLLGIVGGYFVKSVIQELKINKAKKTADSIISDAEKEARNKKKEALLETKEEIHRLRSEADKDIRERKSEIVEAEKRIRSREDGLDRRSSLISRREEQLESKEVNISKKQSQLLEKEQRIEKVLNQQLTKLEEISNMSQDEAKEIIMQRTEEEIAQEIAAYIKEEEEKAKITVDRTARSLLALAMQKYASETTSEKTVSVVSLPNDEMKGRIIGREGRNIRTLETLTGVDLIIDDTPEAVVLSGFDPIRREVAKRSLEALVHDGRIHPARIEEVVEKTSRDVDELIRTYGEEAIFETGIGRVHPDLIRLLGRLNYRTSYGQNVLRHSIETAFLAGKLAAEIGEDEILARRAGLLHDIGKAVDHEVEGSHVEIGGQIAIKYKEHPSVIDAIKSHHGDEEPQSIIASLVAAADALSAARPGARSESLENYLKRLEKLEQIAYELNGVDKTYAIQAGREIRVLVKPEEINDLEAHKIARDVKNKIEDQLNYPGTIKVTVIRETRAIEVAK